MVELERHDGGVWVSGINELSELIYNRGLRSIEREEEDDEK